MSDWFSPIYAIFVMAWLMALAALSGCTMSTLTVNGDGNTTSVMQSPINTVTATIPVSAIPGLPGAPLMLLPVVPVGPMVPVQSVLAQHYLAHKAKSGPQ